MPRLTHHVNDLSQLLPSTDALDINGFSEVSILNAFKTIKANLSSGPDGIPGMIVVDCKFSFIKPPKHIFDLIVQSSCFPDT